MLSEFDVRSWDKSVKVRTKKKIRERDSTQHEESAFLCFSFCLSFLCPFVPPGFILYGSLLKSQYLQYIHLSRVYNREGQNGKISFNL